MTYEIIQQVNDKQTKTKKFLQNGVVTHCSGIRSVE